MNNLNSEFSKLSLDEILPDSIKLMCYYDIISPLKKYSLKQYLNYNFINATYLCAFDKKVRNDEVTSYLLKNMDNIKFIDTEKLKNCTIQYIYLNQFVYLNPYKLSWSYYWDFFNLKKKYSSKTNVYKHILKNEKNELKLNEKLSIMISGTPSYKLKLIKLYKNIKKNYIKLKK